MLDDLIQTFKERNITLIPVENSQEACKEVFKNIPDKSSVGCGWSETLKTSGILDKIRQGDYTFYDIFNSEYHSEEYYKTLRLAQQADYYLSSSNAITKDGKIVNGDGTGNRTSSLIFGPKHVIIVAGKNKIVENLDEAIKRIEKIAAPLNAKRIGSSVQNIWCSTTIIENQKDPNRMMIILVDEELGY